VKITLEISDELATQLQPFENQLPEILELGFTKFSARSQSEFEDATEVLEFFATLPTPDEIIALRASEKLQNRIRELLDKNRAIGLTASEQKEWQQYEYVEHLVRIAKAKAHAKLKGIS
jgi:hypothetical protein